MYLTARGHPNRIICYSESPSRICFRTDQKLMDLMILCITYSGSIWIPHPTAIVGWLDCTLAAGGWMRQVIHIRCPFQEALTFDFLWQSGFRYQQLIQTSAVAGVIILILVGIFAWIKCARWWRYRKTQKRKHFVKELLARREYVTVPVCAFVINTIICIDFLSDLFYRHSIRALPKHFVYVGAIDSYI